MAIFNKNNNYNKCNSIVKTTFAEKLSNIKTTFLAAYNQASALNDEMQKEIEAKQAQIQLINTQIKEISTTQDETKRFISNLEKFIK